jgi:hypothetical protein
MGCNCQATKCADNRCGCRKEGYSCDSSCKCKGCKNKARGEGGGAGQCQRIKQDGTRCSFLAKSGNYCGYHYDPGDEEIAGGLKRLQLQERQEEELRRAEYARQAAEEKQRQQQEELRRAEYARQAAEEKQRQQAAELRRAEYARQAAKEKERKEREKVVIENRQREFERMEKDKILRESSERLKKQDEELRRARQAAEERQRQHQEELRRARAAKCIEKSFPDANAIAEKTFRDAEKWKRECIAAEKKQKEWEAELEKEREEKERQEREAQLEKERQEREQALRDREARLDKKEEENQNKTFIEHSFFKYNRSTDSIGKGAFGEVYKAQKDFTYYALKFPGTENANNDELKKEIQLMRELQHPNIVRYYGYTYNAQGHMGIVLEFLDGGSLYDHLHKSKPPPVWTVEQKKEGVLQLIRGLMHLHGKEFVHRDLKSANVLLRSGSLNLYLSDFGLTLKKDRDSEGNYKPESPGTNLYKAPELWRSGIPPVNILDWKRADVYALCSVIGEIVTGMEPHAYRTSPPTLRQAVLNGGRPFQSEDLNSVLTEEGIGHLMSGWDGDPECRENLKVLYDYLKRPNCWVQNTP